MEINSSFYRSHRLATYERWAAATPPTFRFAVKLPKQVTHVNRLSDAELHVAQFVAETAGLGEKLAAILVQLPPSLSFDSTVAETFFRVLRAHVNAAILCEPRHFTWFSPDADSLLRAHEIDRVAADPSIVPAAATPGIFARHAYFRWHGSPQMYYSEYDENALSDLKRKLVVATEAAETVWCIFDNTALGAATANALALAEMFTPTFSTSRG